MLFLDSSALAKFYFQEAGSEAMLRRLQPEIRTISASLLSFAEVHAAIARKHRENQIPPAVFLKLRAQFERDWSNLVEVVDLRPQIMASVPGLVEQFPLKAADAIQLATALWLRDELKAVRNDAGALEFVAADRTLLGAARSSGLSVFNPEEEN